MAKLTLTNISSGYLTATAQNANNDAIEAAMENTLSRDGTSPNTMGADIDLNSHKVINLADGVNPGDAVTIRQYDAASSPSATAAAASAAAAATSETNAATSETNAASSASSASTSAGTATTQAGNASTSASNAASSASAASSSASAAAASAASVNLRTINRQAGNYTILTSDKNKLVEYIGAGGHTFTLPTTATLGDGFEFHIKNAGTGNLTVDANAVGGTTIDDVATITLIAGQSCVVVTDQTNNHYEVTQSRGYALLATASTVTNVPAGNIAATNVQAAINELDTEKAALTGFTTTGNVFVSGAVAGARSLGVVNTDAGISSYAQFYAQSNNGYLVGSINSAASGGVASVYSTGVGGMYHYTSGAYIFKFGTNSTLRWTIDSSSDKFGPGDALTYAQTSAPIQLRKATPGNQIEFGAPASSGYGCTIGAFNDNSQPFIAFNGEFGTNVNTIRTRGIPATVLTTDASGNFSIKQAVTASADNQTPTTRLYLDTSGSLFVGGTTVGAAVNPVHAANTAKAFVNFNASSGTPTIRKGYNVSSITDGGVGTFTANLTNATITTNSTVIASSMFSHATASDTSHIHAYPSTTSAIVISNTDSAGVQIDSQTVCVAAFD